MRHVPRFGVALALCLAAPVMAGVRPRDPAVAGAAANVFDPAQSAALFVGVRTFTHDKALTEVRYGVDDAIDLAFALSLGNETPLVKPERIVLALSGEPQKPESKGHLASLLAAGAVVSPATQSDLLLLLEQQARTAGSQGILIVSFATHGVTGEGVQFLLTATSLVRHRETAIPEAEVREIASTSKAARCLILVDACRQRLTSDSRDGEPDPRSAAAPLNRGMAAIDGQVVFSAAASGGYAFDDDGRRNGVFTAAVIDGLQCDAAADADGLVTVDTLSVYVEERVLSWIQQHRDPKARVATQLNAEGRARLMPLAACAHGARRTGGSR